MYGNCIIPTSERAVYDIPAYIRKGVILEPLPSKAIKHSLEPEKPATEPQTPPNVDIPVVVPKPEKGEGQENTQDPPKPKTRRSRINLSDQAWDLFNMREKIGKKKNWKGLNNGR